MFDLYCHWNKSSNKEELTMTGWTFFFVLVSVVFLTAQVFRVIDAIERPTQHHRRHAALR